MSRVDESDPSHAASVTLAACPESQLKTVKARDQGSRSLRCYLLQGLNVSFHLVAEFLKSYAWSFFRVPTGSDVDEPIPEVRLSSVLEVCIIGLFSLGILSPQELLDA